MEMGGQQKQCIETIEMVKSVVTVETAEAIEMVKTVATGEMVETVQMVEIGHGGRHGRAVVRVETVVYYNCVCVMDNIQRPLQSSWPIQTT